MTIIRQMSLWDYVKYYVEIMSLNAELWRRSDNRPKSKTCPAPPANKKQPLLRTARFAWSNITQRREKAYFLSRSLCLRISWIRASVKIRLYPSRGGKCFMFMGLCLLGWGSVFPPLSLSFSTKFILKSSSWCLMKIIQMSGKCQKEIISPKSQILRYGHFAVFWFMHRFIYWFYLIQVNYMG